MKKILVSLTLIGGFAAATSASADEFLGVYLTGAQYQADLNNKSAYRLGLGFSDGFFQGNLGASADYIGKFPRNALGSGFNPYWGAGAAVGFGNGVSVAPRAFVGTDFVINSNARVFGEVGAKYTINTSSANANALGVHTRVGVNFNIR